VGCEGEVHRPPPPPYARGGSHGRSPMDVHSLSSALRSLCAIAIKKNEALTWLTSTCNSLSLSLFLSLSLSLSLFLSLSLSCGFYCARIRAPACLPGNFVYFTVPPFVRNCINVAKVTRALVHLPGRVIPLS